MKKLTWLNRIAFSCLAASLLLASCGNLLGDDDDDDAPPADDTIKIVALGDSLTAGYRANNTDADDKTKSYPAYLQTLLGNVPDMTFSVVNAGVTGDTTADGYARVQTDVISKDPNAVLVCLGANDFLAATSEAELGAAITSIGENLTAIVEALNNGEREIYIAKFYTDTVARDMLAGIGITDTATQTQVIGACDSVYDDLVADYGVTLIEDIWTGVWDGVDTMSDDGIHPLAAGYEVMAQKYLDAMMAEE